MEEDRIARWQSQEGARVPKSGALLGWDSVTRIRMCRDGIGEVLKFLPKSESGVVHTLQRAWLMLDASLQAASKNEVEQWGPQSLL